MAYLELEPHVGYGLVDGRAVFLDLRRDRYVALERTLEESFRRLRSASEPALPAGADADALLATGLFRRTCLRVRSQPAPAETPSASLLDEPDTRRPGWVDTLRAWATVAQTRRRLAGQPLLEIVDRLRESRRYPRPPGDATATEDAARLFLAARAFVPVPRACLLDALAMLDWLGDVAGGVTLVFGVRLDPFGAHCWLQTDRLLLTDAHDTVGMFVPVMSV